VQGYESNSEFADYYSTQYVLFKKNRVFENVEQKIEAVKLDDIERVVKEYLTEDKAVTIYETPTLTYTQLYILLSLLFILVVVTAFLLYVRVHVRLKNKRM
jgi:predicted Zn-dependent peptidase